MGFTFDSFLEDDELTEKSFKDSFARGSLSVEKLHELIHNNNFEAKIQLASYGGLKYETLKKLVYDTDNLIVQESARNVTLKYEEIKYLIKHPDKNVRKNLAFNFCLTSGNLSYLVLDSDDDVRSVIAARFLLPVDIMARLVLDSSVKVRRQAAQNPEILKSMIGIIARDSDEEIRIFSASAKWLPRDLKLELAQDSSIKVKLTLATREDLDLQVVERLILHSFNNHPNHLYDILLLLMTNKRLLNLIKLYHYLLSVENNEVNISFIRKKIFLSYFDLYDNFSGQMRGSFNSMFKSIEQLSEISPLLIWAARNNYYLNINNDDIGESASLFFSKNYSIINFINFKFNDIISKISEDTFKKMIDQLLVPFYKNLLKLSDQDFELKKIEGNLTNCSLDYIKQNLGRVVNNIKNPEIDD